MLNNATLLRLAVFVAIAAALTLPAQAVQQAKRTSTHKTHWMQTEGSYRGLYARADRIDTRCTWPFRNQFPPCMSTWPEGDPRYHGGQAGPTFRR
jgi:hypothetical protein